jgi:hypothetical protein
MDLTSERSILLKPEAIALLVNENALDDLKIFLYTLELWNTTYPTLYIYCTESVKIILPSLNYKGFIYTSTKQLEIYKNLTRKEMEQLPSRKKLSNLFHDFTLEKTNLMKWAIEEHKKGVLFCDADILWLGPLPEIPENTELALSPHEIEQKYEDRFGKYNAGFLYIQSKEIVEIWYNETLVSKFFEQLALDQLAKYIEPEPYIFGRHINYGWWRMFQAPVTYTERIDEWSIKAHKTHENSGLTVKNIPVICIHTHWKTKDSMTKTFNTFIYRRLLLVKHNPLVEKLLSFLTSPF